jgi:hypothetical protein
MRGIDITESHDLHFGVAGHTAHGAAPHAGDADAGHLEQGVRRLAAGDGWEAEDGRCNSGLSEEMAAFHGGNIKTTSERADISLFFSLSLPLPSPIS